MTHCICCYELIPDRLYEYGDLNAPMCLSCYLAEEEMAADLVFRCEPIVNGEGRQIGHRSILTEYGVAFFDGDGTPGEVCAITYY